MKSWKEDNLLNIRKDLLYKDAFECSVSIEGGRIKIVEITKDRVKSTIENTINASEAKLLDEALKQDPTISTGRGLATALDYGYDDYIESILYDRIKWGDMHRTSSDSYIFKPVIYFKVKGVFSSESYDTRDKHAFLTYIQNFMEIQCRDEWGVNFRKKSFINTPNLKKYFNPWSNEGEVWICDVEEKY